jgi:hypothetical protein
MTSLGYLQYSEISDSSSVNSTMSEIDKKKQARHNITIKKRLDTNPNSENVQNMLKLINNSNGYDNEDGNGLADFNPPPRAEVSTKISGPQNAEGMEGQGQMQMQAPGQMQQGQMQQGQMQQGQMQQGQMPAQQMQMPQGQMQAQQGQMQAQQGQVQAQQGQVQPSSLNIDFEKPTSIAAPTNATTYEQNVKPRQYPAPMDSYEGFNSLPKTYATDYYKQYVPYFNQTGQTELSKNQLYEKLNYMIHLLEEQKDEKTGHVMEEVILYSFLGVFIIFIIDSFARVGKYTR